MRHIVIGDIHGRDNWQRINIKSCDKIIFIGDYVDSPTLSDYAILENFKKIINLKKRHMDKVILLLGNHDAHYLHYPHHQCSGFRKSMQRDLTAILRRNADLFQIAYQKDNYLFTHAGVTNNWYNEIQRLPKIKEFGETAANIAGQLNQIEHSAFRTHLYDAGISRGGYGCGGPLWADLKESFSDCLHGCHQIVGHTKVEEIRTISYTDRSITYTDVLTAREQFHELDI
ncbi:metallophosphoesterase [Mucilaginibacter corticis]|uniref:Metallophosphoesterase n=1 Tax=Mucilaginibacter corticis TaxID=2597670 RepID=A0A556MM14_9SPHI|nr:metallophosphoesterase [Mucilaginibacter corticis]TSJ40961.1 metallophosphoesterase [Mucilaginibacter corticis]